MKNILIVGAGFSGAVIARELAEHDYKVTVIDKRKHMAGNAYDYINEYGIRVHEYGPHLFHTSNQKVVDWLSKFTEWLPYKHRVKALLSDGKFVTLPPNLETSKIVGAENLFKIFYEPYTKKMWGMDAKDIDPGILSRVSARDDDNEYYFPNDSFQAIPKNGYTAIFEEIFNHPRINLKLNYPYQDGMYKDFYHTFNSMPIDEFFEYSLGHLPYRSIKFKTFTIPVPQLLPVPTVNFTHEGPFTRVTEWKQIPGHCLNNEFYTTITVEEPCDYASNNFERYYPVKDLQGLNRIRYKQYESLVSENMTFIGRCGLYAYLDMHQAINSSLEISKKFLNKN